VSYLRERVYGWVGIAVTSVAFVLFVAEFVRQYMHHAAGSPGVDAVVFLLIVFALLYGNFVFQFTRLGYLKRKAAHAPSARDELESIYHSDAPRLAILVPSYREEPRVLQQTILSAALVEYPARRIAVLIDDPPAGGSEGLAALQATRQLVVDLDCEFRDQASALLSEQQAFLRRLQRGFDGAEEAVRLAHAYQGIAAWLDAWTTRIDASSVPAAAHADRLFVDKILRGPADAHRRRAAELQSATLDRTRAAYEYRRLASLLAVDIESFERKRYANLSHEPNKAMNLNSYIGLIGGWYREVRRNGQLHLEACPRAAATLVPPDADYLLTIDADSIVLPDYALRLVEIMQANARIAVAQTPYSAFPDAPGLLERAAGATTDIQYVIHQGFTRYNSTYWVGANALLRMTALREICKHRRERGHDIAVFIQDRTVIEDTGSTVDLIRGGWTLHNYPERLAYSATPPDFGSLIIQRRRWSNGGLLILPDLLAHLWRHGRLVGRFAETAVRSYYLVSPALANIGLLVLLLYRFDDNVSNWWLPLTALPYYFFYGRDLRSSGYRWSDLLRVYALNLLLLPVNLAGVLRSLQQAVMGRKATFGRTPKIEQRTQTPAFYLLCQFALLAYLVAMMAADLRDGLLVHASFSAINAGFFVYGITQFLGWRNCLADLKATVVAPPLPERAPALQPAIDATAEESVVAPVPAVQTVRVEA